jgi:hypothetical protein
LPCYQASLSEVKQLATLYRICRQETERILAGGEDRSVDGAAANTPITVPEGAVRTIFEQAAARNLHRGLLEEKSAGSAQAQRPNLEKLRVVIGAKVEKATTVLRALGLIGSDQTWENLGETEAAGILASGFEQTLALAS